MKKTEFRTLSVTRMIPACLQAIALVALLAGVHSAGAEDRVVKMRVPPTYPELAKRMKISGPVKLEATVDPDGKVKDVKTISGNRALSVAAEDALRKWKFEPGSGDATVPITINFDLGGN
ncbi:MAG TPA: energy transducer TonB [Terracidiphilus sp.]|nr:energy transducer TonB [Terracidiphilus sp.]